MHWESSSGFRSLVMELVLEEGKEQELGHQWGAYDSRPAGHHWLQVVKVQRRGSQSTSIPWNATHLPVEDQVSRLQDSLSLQPRPLHRGTCNQCLVDAEIQRPRPLALMGAEEPSGYTALWGQVPSPEPVTQERAPPMVTEPPHLRHGAAPIPPAEQESPV